MAGEAIQYLKQAIGEDDYLACIITSNWSSWDGQRTLHKSRINEVRQYVYATSAKDTSNITNDHNHTTHVPKLCQIYDNLKANYISGLMPNPRWFTFEGEDKQAVTKDTRNAIESYLRTKHRLSKFRLVVGSLVDDWLLEGNCFAQVIYKHENHTDPTGLTNPGYRGPVVKRISPTDIVFNPAASSFRDSPKIIRRVMAFGELAQAVLEQPDMKYSAVVFEKMKMLRSIASGMSVEDVNKANQYQLDGFGSYAEYVKSGHVEFLDFYGTMYDVTTNTLYKNHCVTVVDRKWVIRSQPTDTWNGHPAIFQGTYRSRPDNLWAMGPLENLVGMNYRINHLENAKADAFDLMLNPDRVVVGDVEEELDDETGAVTYYISSERGDVKNLAPDSTVLNADFQIDKLKNDMEEMAGAPRQGVGIRTPGEKTKFEVGVLENNSSRLFQYNMAEFEMSFLEDILNCEVELGRKNLAREMDTIRLDDDQLGVKLFMNVSAADITANGRITPVGARHYARTAQLAQNLMNLNAALATDKEVMMHFSSVKMAKVWEELMEFEEFDMVQPYARIPEAAQANRLMAAAQDQVQSENMVDLQNEGTDGEVTPIANAQ